MNNKPGFIKPMRTIFQLCCFALLAAVLLASCNKSSENANYIPKDANVVVTVDVKSLGLKSMGFKDIFSLNSFKKLLSKKNESADTSIGNLKESGVDLLTNAYLFGSFDEKSNGYGAAILCLSNESKFEEFTKKLFKQATITSEGDYKLATSQLEPNTIIVWNSKTAVLLSQSSELSIQAKERSLSILQLKKEESLVSVNQNFESFLKEPSDLSLWLNFEKLGSVAKKFGANTNASSWKDNYLTMNCNFDNGQVVINSKYYANKETSEQFNLSKGTITKETATIIPAESLIGMFGISLDLNKTYSLLDQEQVVAMIEEQATKTTGMTVKDLFQIFNGEIVASFNGVVQQDIKSYDINTGTEEMKKETLPQFSFILGVSDKAKSAQLLATLSEKGILTKEENAYSIKNLYSIIDLGSHLILVPENQKQVVLSQTGKKLDADRMQILTQNSASLYLNFKDIPESSLGLLNPNQRELLRKLPVESVVISSEPIKDKVSHGKCLITFKEKGQNSLVTIAKISDDFAKLETESTETPLNQEQLETIPVPEDAQVNAEN